MSTYAFHQVEWDTPNKVGLVIASDVPHPPVVSLSLLQKCHKSYSISLVEASRSTKLDSRCRLPGLWLLSSLVDPGCIPKAGQWSRTFGIFVGVRLLVDGAHSCMCLTLADISAQKPLATMCIFTQNDIS